MGPLISFFKAMTLETFLSKVNLSNFAVAAAATGTRAAAATEAAKARAAATDAATADAAAATDATAATDAALAVATDGTPAAAKEVAAACFQDTLFLCLSLTLGSMCNRHGCHQTFAAVVQQDRRTVIDSILL